MTNELYGFDAKKVTGELVTWIRDWFDRNGPDSTAVIGISGGKDSTVAAALCVKALGTSRVLGVTLPDKWRNMDGDVPDICKHLGIEWAAMNITTTRLAIAKEIKRSAQVGGLSVQASINLPPRIRMTFLFAVAQSVNGRVVGTCNLSEDYVGYSTYGGDAFASVMPLARLTSDEVIAVGLELGVDKYFLLKTPADGLCGKSDEDNLGFTYAVLNRYIRTGECDDEVIKKRIDSLHKKNLFKLRMPESFPYLTEEEKRIVGRMV